MHDFRHSDLWRRSIGACLVVAVAIMLQGTMFGCAQILALSNHCAMGMKKAHTAGHSCCPRSKPASVKKSCCQEQPTEPADCCSVPARRQLAKHEDQITPAKMIAVAQVAAVLFYEPPRPPGRMYVEGSGDTFTKPVFELKTDLRI